MSFRYEGPRDPANVPRSSAFDLTRHQVVVGPRDGNAGVLGAQKDVDAAVNKADDAQLEDEAALDRSARSERASSEIRQSNRELLEKESTWNARFLGTRRVGRSRVRRLNA
uniref:Uncharacterized protein n=1 Tax=Peronospora matthiolae TaxID=2874970 RepID=A0AAV1TH51_9STRA